MVPKRHPCPLRSGVVELPRKEANQLAGIPSKAFHGLTVLALALAFVACEREGGCLDECPDGHPEEDGGCPDECPDGHPEEDGSCSEECPDSPPQAGECCEGSLYCPYYPSTACELTCYAVYYPCFFCENGRWVDERCHIDCFCDDGRPTWTEEDPEEPDGGTVDGEEFVGDADSFDGSD